MGDQLVVLLVRAQVEVYVHREVPAGPTVVVVLVRLGELHPLRYCHGAAFSVFSLDRVCIGKHLRRRVSGVVQREVVDATE